MTPDPSAALSTAQTTTEITLSPARASRSFDEVVRQLRALILDGSVPVGERLPAERTLAEQFQVSRNMVREALRMLEVTGMVELRKGRNGGAYVRSGRPEIVSRSLSDMMVLAAFSLRDLYEARLWLSSAVVRAVAERADDAGLARLDANVAAAVERARAQDWASVAQLNMCFHDMLSEIAGNPVLMMIHASVMGVIRQISQSVGPITSDRTIRHRLEIMRLLRARDGEEAAAEMARNLTSVHEFWLARIGDRQIGSIMMPLPNGSTII